MNGDALTGTQKAVQIWETENNLSLVDVLDASGLDHPGKSMKLAYGTEMRVEDIHLSVFEV